MAENIRRSTRPVKPNKDSDYEYEEEVLDALSGRQTHGANVSKTAIVEDYSDSVFISCEEVEITPVVINDSENIVKGLDSVTNRDIVKINKSPLRYFQAASLRASDSVRPKSQFVNIASGARRNSSTDVGFVDIEGNFLSANSLSDMSGSESNVDNTGGIKSSYNWQEMPGAVGGVGVNTVVNLDTVLAEAVMTALDKMDKVAEQIETLNFRMERLEVASVRGSVRGSGSESENRGKGLASGKSKSKPKSKIERVEFEKDRQSRVLMQKLLEKTKKKDTETETEDTQDDEQPRDLKTMRNSMSKM